MSTLKTNTLTGTTSAGVINVTGEGGSTTTNLQQGLAKVWGQGEGDTVTLTDSFNQSAFTDNGTGQFIHNFSNNMSNDDYSPLSSGTSGDHLISSTGTTTTSACRFDHYGQNNAAVDTAIHGMAIFGDLA
tara:strand:+ start:764 stop:1153 length:390 start_codon:yes stop_codon:yes gene_type:complete